MSSAGQANEAGSVARRNAAMYFGVHMLVGSPIQALRNNKVITHIAFESTDPTDDMVLAFDDESRAFVSVKRKMAKGEPFSDTVQGWVDQLHADLADEDVLVAVCEESVQWVRDLAVTLTRLRSGVAAGSAPYGPALANLDELVPADKRDEMRRRAHIIELPRTPTNNDGWTVLVSLMNSIVEGNAGASAVSAIAESVHDWAGSAGGCDVHKLVGAIAARGIVLRADPDGPPAVRAAAARAAVDNYLEGLASSNGRVDLSLLAQDLEPVVVEDLLAGVRVTNPEEERDIGEDLRVVVRRNRRMVVVGLPGSGKSLLMRELAGWCSTDPHAPAPLPVRLPDLLPRNDDHAVTAADLVALAAERGPRGNVAQVEEFLTRAVENGDAILLLDGLDECREKAPWMANQLKTLVAGLPDTVGVVIATRGSAEVPAKLMGLPLVRLERPIDLDTTLEAVLEQCAARRVPRPDDRPQWLESRHAWLRDARQNQPGMLQVPQLAILVALIISSNSHIEIPSQRALLLHKAVTETIERWEHSRFPGTAGGSWTKDLSPEMLLDGFVALGRLIDGSLTPCTKSEALGVVCDMLVEAGGWNLPRKKAQELATQIVVFWDTHVAVFVLDEQDRLISRSRVFTEIATAQWTTTCSDVALQQWASDAIRFYDSEGVIALALGLNPRLTQVLVESSESTPEATLAVAGAVKSGAATLTATQLDSLLRHLGEHANHIESGAKGAPTLLRRERDMLSDWLAANPEPGPTSWPFVELLCALDLDKRHRHGRDLSLAAIPLAVPYRTIVSAWVTLKDALADERPLGPCEVEAIFAVLARDLPEPGELVREGRVHRFTSHEKPDPGVGTVALCATEFLKQLPREAAELIYRISESVAAGEGEHIQVGLSRAGVDTSNWKRPKGSSFMDSFKAFEALNLKRRLLEDIESLGDTNTSLSKRHRWSLPTLADLLYATGYQRCRAPDIADAFEHDSTELRRKWLNVVAVALDIDVDVAAAEAAFVRRQPDDRPGTPADWRVAISDPLARTKSFKPTSLPPDDQEALLECMNATSDWMSWSALYILVNITPTWDTIAFFDQERADWTPHRASDCYFVCLLASTHGSELAARAAKSPESVQRHALQRALPYRPDLDPTGDMASQLGRDKDLWVRGRYDLKDPAPSYWTCSWCAQRNSAPEESCTVCNWGSRPEHDGARAMTNDE